MQFNTKLPSSLKPHYTNELMAYRRAFESSNLSVAWCHLERAHIIGQAYPLAHSYVHWEMLLFGFHTKNMKEIIGQLPRLLVGGVKSFVGKVPLGNTGGSNVPPMRPMPIPAELKEMFEAAGITS